MLVVGLKGNEAYQVTVVNALGVKVMSEMLVYTNLLGEFSMKVAELPTGIYFIQVNGVTGRVMAKFVKQ